MFDKYINKIYDLKDKIENFDFKNISTKSKMIFVGIVSILYLYISYTIFNFIYKITSKKSLSFIKYILNLTNRDVLIFNIILLAGITSIYIFRDKIKEWIKDKFNKEGDELATGGLGTKKDIKDLAGRDGLYLSKEVRLAEKTCFEHIAIIGPTGSGKSSTFFIPNLLSLPPHTSIIVTDPKGELYKKTAVFQKKQGKKVLAFAPLDPNISEKYNPLEVAISITEVREIAQNTLMNGSLAISLATDRKGGDSDWINMATPLWTAMLLYAWALIQKKKKLIYNNVIEKIVNMLQMDFKPSKSRENEDYVLSQQIDKYLDTKSNLNKTKYFYDDETDIFYSDDDTEEDDNYYQEGLLEIKIKRILNKIKNLDSFDTTIPYCLQKVLVLSKEEMDEMFNPSLFEIDFNEAKQIIIEKVEGKISIDYIDSLFEIINILREASLQYSIFNQSAGSERTASSIKTVLGSNLQIFTDPNIVKTCSGHDFNPIDIRKEPTAIYVITPERKSIYVSPFISIFYSQVLNRLLEHDGCPTYLMLDEFANIGVIPYFAQIAATCRSRKISLSIGIQGIEQLWRNYGKENGDDILNNMKTKVFYPGLAYSTAEYASKLCGNKTVRAYSQDSNNNKNWSYQRKEVLDPDEVRRLEGDKVLIVMHNRKPIIDKQNIYYKDRKYLARIEELSEILNNKKLTEMVYKNNNPSN